MKNQEKTKEQLISELEELRQDKHEHKKAEEALRESEEKYRILFETMEQGVVYQNASGEIISANPAAERVLGLTLDQMQGRISIDPRWQAVHEDGSDFPGEEHPSMIALKTCEVVNDVIMGVFNPETEAYRWILINAVPQLRTGEDKPYQVYTTFTDITERKRAEETLRKSEQRFRTIADFTYDSEYWIGPDNDLIYQSPSIERITGHTAEEHIENHPGLFFSLVHPEDKEQFSKHFENDLSSSEVTRFTFRIITQIPGKMCTLHELYSKPLT